MLEFADDCWKGWILKSVPRRSVLCVGVFSVVEAQRYIFGCPFTAKHLTMLGLFGVALSKRRAENEKRYAQIDPPPVRSRRA